MTNVITAYSTASGDARHSFRGTRAVRSVNGIRRLVGSLFVLDVAVLFGVSGGMLWMAGLNYDGISGSAASKIHPATYLAVITFSLALFARRNPGSMLSTIERCHRGSLVLFLVFVAVEIFVVLTNRPGPAGMIDTFWLPALFAVIAADATDLDKARAERLLHLLLAANATLTIFEFIVGWQFFPFRFEGQLWFDNRPTALQGHMLENACVTGEYAVILMCGGGAAMPRELRAPMIVLQLAALVASGGRAALTFVVPVVAWVVSREIAKVLMGARMSRLRAAMWFVSPLLAGAGALVLANAGFFDVVIQRFKNDGGSAETRLVMFDVFSYIPVQDLLFAPDVETVKAVRSALGLALGIENPILELILYKGVLATAALILGVAFYLRGIIRPLQGRVAFPLAYFLLVIMSFDSLGTKSTLISKFAVLMITMFRPRDRTAEDR